jgi:NAD(P)H dehydrogenase (quinone)
VTVVAIIYHSASGRTRALAEAVARGVAAGDATPIVQSVEQVDHAALLAADAIIFGCPTYMGSASAAFKAFMDGTSAIWALQAWRDKLAAAFTCSGAPSGDKLGTLMQLAVFAAQHGMVWVGLGLPPTYAGVEPVATDTNRLGSHLGAMAHAPPGIRVVNESDLLTAVHLGRRVAEAARRWERPAVATQTMRHPATNTWVFPSPDRPALPAPLERTNLRELVARPERLEHHLVVCATLGSVQLEIVTASEPLYFGHVNLSDEYALPLRCGDDLVDRFPLRTFLTDATTGADVGRYNHRNGDLVLHPVGLLHWPGKLRPPYEPFDVPPGIRRCGLSLVYCANVRTASTAPALPVPAHRAGDVKAYATPAPPMMLASVWTSEPGVLAAIGSTELALIEHPEVIAPPRGGWVVVLEATGTTHAACDLIRVPAGATLAGTGITRALVLTGDASPDRAPDTWRTLPAPPFATFEDAPPGALPITAGDLSVSEVSPSEIAVTIRGARTTVPRYWLARMLFRCALHQLRLGYVETYGGFYVDDGAPAEGAIVLGIREGAAIEVSRAAALALIEQLYRAVAPANYRERLV